MTHRNSLSSKQIRAARALVDWSQDDLASTADLSVATIRKIESGDLSPRLSTLEQIKTAFEKEGLEFLEPNGVRQRPEEVTIYEGREGLCAYFDDVYAAAMKKNADIVTVCINEDPITDILGAYGDIHRARMSALVPHVSVKCILTENFKSVPADYCEYRSISKAYVDSVPFYIYGNNYAMFLFDAKPSPKIIIHHSPLLAAAYRKQFYSMWDKATIVQVPKYLRAKMGRESK